MALSDNLHAIHFSVDLFEEFVEAVVGWEVDFRQLGPAAAPFRLSQLLCPDFLYSRAEFGCRFHQLGGPQLGHRTFALAGQDCSPFSWCGQRIARTSLIVFPSAGDFEAVSEVAFNNHTLSLSERVLRSVAERKFGQPLEEMLSAERAVHHHCGTSILRLRKKLELLARHIRAGTPHTGLVGSNPMLYAEQLATLVLDCVGSRGDGRFVEKHSQRRRALRDALQLIKEQPEQATDVVDLVAHCGVSRRTLEYAFSDALGLSPSAYLKTLALTRLNARLFAAEAGSHRVADIASELGFHHAGQLARDYFQLFGERPGDTLRRTAHLHRQQYR